MGASAAATVLSVAFLVIVGAPTGSQANMDDEHDPNDGVLLDSLMKTKDSRSFLNDLIYKIQLLLNDTDEHSTTSQAVRSAKRVYVSQAAAKPAAVPSNRWKTVKVPTRINSSSISDKSSTSNSSRNSSTNSSTSSANGSRNSNSSSNITIISSAAVLQQHAWMLNASLESLLASPELTLDAPVINQTALATNETSGEAEKQVKKPIGPDASQRVATLGVIICLTFVGTATCIVVMALYSSKFSGIILLSNGRWWCPMVTRGNGVERQLLV